MKEKSIEDLCLEKGISVGDMNKIMTNSLNYFSGFVAMFDKEGAIPSDKLPIIRKGVNSIINKTCRFNQSPPMYDLIDKLVDKAVIESGCGYDQNIGYILGI